MPSRASAPPATPASLSAQPPTPPPPATEPLFDDPSAVDDLFPKADAASVGLHGPALDNLVRAAASSDSDALIVLKDGKTVVHRTFGHAAEPIETMSVTKSISALAIGLLLGEGKIRSADEPLSTWFPSWKDGRKGRVTLRHVLSQTSGLAHQQATASLNGQRDRLAYALQREVTEEPGTVFSYNNEASQLVAGIVRKAAGVPIDTYLRDKLFEPLGIRRWSWQKDRAGNAQTYYGLRLTPAGLARIGALLQSDGLWEGHRVLASEWVKAVSSRGTAANDYYGLMWWLRFAPPIRVQTKESLSALAQGGFGDTARLSPLTDIPYESDAAYWLEAGALLPYPSREALSKLASQSKVPFALAPGPQRGFYADGWLGQRLAVYPAWNLVAVRMHKSRHGGDEAESKSCGMPDFLKLVEATVARAN